MTEEIFSPSITPPSTEELVSELERVLRSLSVLSGSGWSVLNLATKMAREKRLSRSDKESEEVAGKIINALLSSIAVKARAAKPEEADLFTSAQARAIGAMRSAGIQSRSEVAKYLPRVLASMAEGPKPTPSTAARTLREIPLGSAAREILRQAHKPMPSPRKILSQERKRDEPLPEPRSPTYWWQEEALK